MERSVIRHSAGRHLFFIISADSGFEHLKNIIFIRWWTTCPISTEDALHDYVINMYFNKEIIFKNQKSQAIATIRHLQKIDLFAKTRAECQLYYSTCMSRRELCHDPYMVSLMTDCMAIVHAPYLCRGLSDLRQRIYVKTELGEESWT